MTTIESVTNCIRQPARILVADADADTRALYAASFAPPQWSVIEAVDGRDALVKALTRPPSALITELHLPIIDGVALCEILRRDRVTKDVPIVVLTAEARAPKTSRALSAGADVVLTKPTRMETVAVELERLLARSVAARGRAAVVLAKAAASLERSHEVTARHRVMLSHIYARTMTSMPPLLPPELTCSACDAPLKYEHSFVGGVSERHSEQWDYYTCPQCGTFQYRQRTRKLRQVG